MRVLDVGHLFVASREKYMNAFALLCSNESETIGLQLILSTRSRSIGDGLTNMSSFRENLEKPCSDTLSDSGCGKGRTKLETSRSMYCFDLFCLPLAWVLTFLYFIPMVAE